MELHVPPAYRMRHLVIILSFCTLFAGSAASQVRQLPKPVSDSTTDNQPKPPGRVSDYEQVFTPVQIGQLNSLIRRFQEATTNEIAGITIDSSRVKKEAFDDYTLAIARQWGVGNKQLNNGHPHRLQHQVPENTDPERIWHGGQTHQWGNRRAT